MEYGRTDKMFVLTVKTKINNKKKFLFMCAFGLILILAVVFVSCDNTPKSAYCKEIGEYSLSFSTSNDKKTFLSYFNVTGQPVTIDNVRIPENFNSTYERYNKIQKTMGLDLNNFKGKTTKRYVCKGKDNYFVSILTYKGKVVGCHKSKELYGSDFVSLLKE